jgi:thiamine phosphate synthase YjbQ (UPF0047 family)
MTGISSFHPPWSRSGAVKSFTEHLTFHISARMDFVNITAQAAECLRKSGLQEGFCLVKARRQYGT